MRVEGSLMSTDESKRTYKTSAIQRAIQLVAKAKELGRELRASARETKRSRRLSKSWRVASQKRNAVRDGKELTRLFSDTDLYRRLRRTLPCNSEDASHVAPRTQRS